MCGVGVGRSLSYLRPAEGTASEALVVEVGSGCGRWACGHVEVTGPGCESMGLYVTLARAWVVANQQAILRVLGCGQQGRAWGSRDLHVHFAQGSWQGMNLSYYSAAVAVAMVAFFTGRPAATGVAVLGQVTSCDVLMRTGVLVETEEQVGLLVEQGFTRLLLPYPETMAADEPSGQQRSGRGSIRRQLQEAGVEVVVAPEHRAPGYGRSLLAALPLIFQ